jgi:hypothetical protein
VDVDPLKHWTIQSNVPLVFNWAGVNRNLIVALVTLSTAPVQTTLQAELVGA